MNRLCAECLRHGRTTAATQLDHIQRAADAPEKFYREDNWQWLCEPCHEVKTKRENGTGEI